MQVHIAAKDLRVAYDQFVALTIPVLDVTGSVIAILGHNGAGKSTLLKSLLGLLPPVSGSLAMDLGGGGDGQKNVVVPERDMAFCPETGSVFADISVESYVKFWCRVKRRDSRYYQREGKWILELLDVDPLLKKLGRELSKGQRRRVQTAIGFLLEPKVFLFDEPFDGLDVQRTSELSDIIRDRKEHTAFVISSHRMDVIERLADHAIVLRGGTVLASGTVEEVSRALSPGAPSLVDAMNSHLHMIRGEAGQSSRR